MCAQPIPNKAEATNSHAVPRARRVGRGCRLSSIACSSTPRLLDSWNLFFDGSGPYTDIRCQGRGVTIYQRCRQWPSLLSQTLTNIEGFLADDPDLSITINRSDLEQTMMGAKKLADQIADGTAKVEGDVGILEQLASTLVVFDPRFEIMPGTKGPATPEDLNDYEYGPLDLAGE